MAEPLSYVRIHADSSGASRLERCDIGLRAELFSPPAPPIDVSDAAAASSVRLLRLAAGWHGDWHPTPTRQWLFFLAGELSIDTGDGGRYVASAGAIVLLEDTSGRGHRTQVGGADVLIAAVQAP